MSIGTCTFPLGDLGGSFWMCGLSSRSLPYGMISNGTSNFVPVNSVTLLRLRVWTIILFTGNFFHGHGWHAYSLFRKCLWNQQQLLLRWPYDYFMILIKYWNLNFLTVYQNFGILFNDYEVKKSFWCISLGYLYRW